MKFVKRQTPKHSEPDKEVDLDRFRRKRKWRKWLLVLLAIALIFGAWYASTIYSAYKSATVKNSNVNSSTVLKHASAADSEPINVLLIGIEGENYPGGMLSDSIMVASVDPKTKSVSLLSVPRDLYVNIPGYGKDKINSAHADGVAESKKTGDKGRGPALLTQTITNTFGIPIHYFVRLDFDGFRKLIDAIGGVDINVKTAINDPLFPNGTGGYAPFSMKVGPQHMNGEVALKYARSRETSSDFARAARQQEIVSATKDKLLSAGVLANPKKVTDIISVIGDHILTDFSAADLTEVIALSKQMSNPTVRTEVIDNSAELGLLRDTKSPIGAYILQPVLGADNYRGLQAFAQGYLATPRIAKEATTITLTNGGVKADVLTKLKQQLEWAGFKATIATESTTATKSTLVDYTNKTPDSISFLKSAYGLESTKATAPEGVAANLSLVVSSDWTEIEKSAAKKIIGAATSPLGVQ